MKKRTPPVKKQGQVSRKRKLFLAAIAGMAVLCLFAAWFVLNYLLFSFTVPPYSMEPSLYPGDRVFVNRLTYRSAIPHRGDIVVYRLPSEPSKVAIHRIIAFPGEAVVLKNHKIIINDIPLTEDWAVKIRHYNGGKLAKKGMKPVIVPQGQYYVLGDNSARSEDSRAWGALPKENIIGKAYRIYYPFNRSGSISPAR
jgi:signal peptidase I